MGRISVVLEFSPLLLSPQPHFYCTEENILTAYPSLFVLHSRWVSLPPGKFYVWGGDFVTTPDGMPADCLR